MKKIFHITSRQVWSEAQAEGMYEAQSLHSQGFIHCSKQEQVIDVANFLFKGRTDLVLMCIDSAMVSSEIRYECLHGGEDLFPHVYGVINLESVTGVLPLNPDEHGLFVLPPMIHKIDE